MFFKNHTLEEKGGKQIKLNDSIKTELEQMIEAGFGEAEDLLGLFADSSKQ